MENYPPFSFLNEQNQLDGFDVDVAKAVAKRLGVKLKLEPPSWDVIAAGRDAGHRRTHLLASVHWAGAVQHRLERYYGKGFQDQR